MFLKKKNKIQSVLLNLKKNLLKIFFSTRWFNLVELIIVITILAILWVVLFVKLDWFIKISRDTARFEELNRIKVALELFSVEKWYYPIPNNYTQISYSWSELWKQWVFWDDLLVTVWKLSKKSVDMYTWNDFTYSVSNKRNEYELWAVLEWNEIMQNNFFTQVLALWKVSARSLVVWEYNWKILDTNSWSTKYILAIPTLISNDLSDSNIDYIIDKQT